MSSRPTYSSVISNRAFRFLWFNQVLVQLAYNTLNFALIIWVYKLTDSHLAVSGLILSVYLPALLFGIFAGVFVDMADRRKIIILIDVLLALAFLAFVFIKGSYPLILLTTFFVNLLSQFYMPAEASSIPMIVTRKQLFLANSLFYLTLYGTLLIGFVSAGPILNFFGINAVFWWGMMLVLLAFMLALNLPEIRVTTLKTSWQEYLLTTNLKRIVKIIASQINQTLRFINGRIPILAVIGLLAGVQGVVGVLAVVMPSYMERILKIHATDSSYFVMLPLGLGMMMGAFLLGRFAHTFPKRSLVVPAIMGVGVLFLLAGLVPLIAQVIQASELPINISQPRYFFRAPSTSLLFALGAAVAGMCAAAIIIPSQTVLQENTPVKLRGKIFAVLNVLMNFFAAVPVLLAGVLADLFGVGFIFVILGFLIFGIGLLAYFPHWFFQERHLPLRWKRFLGMGHWEDSIK